MKRAAAPPLSTRRAGILIFIACLLLYNLNHQYRGTADTAPNVYLPISILLHGDLYLDRYPTLPGTQPGPPYPYYLQPFHGRLISSFPPTPALVALPVYLVPALWLRASHTPYTSETFYLVCVTAAKLAAAVIAAAAVVVVFLTLAPPLGVPRALPLALLFAFGTSAFPIVSQGLWSHGPAMLFLAGAAYLSLHQPQRVAALGTLLGLAVASRPPAVVPAIVFAACAAARDPRRLLQLLGAPLLIATGLAAYNYHFFGSVSGGYEQVNRAVLERQQLTALWTVNPGPALAGLLVSPSRGLLIFSPFAVAAFAGLWRTLRDPRWSEWKPVGLSVAGYLLFFSFYTGWWGGMCYGPRYLTDVSPFLVLLLVPVWQDLQAVRWRRLGFHLLVWTSIFIQTLGAMMWDGEWYIRPTHVDVDHARLWDWKDSEITRLLRNYRWSQTSSQVPAFGGPSPDQSRE